MIVEYTRISLGKYILVMSELLDTRALTDEDRLAAKRFQGKRATAKKIMKGTPWDGIFKTTENTKLRTINWKSGFKMTQAYPKIDCLYLWLISR